MLRSLFHLQSDSAMDLADFDIIEVVNLASPLPTDSCEQVYEPALDLGHNYGDYNKENQPHPSIEKVLRDVKEAQDLQYTGASLAIGEKPADSAVDFSISSDSIDMPLLESPRDEDTSGDRYSRILQAHSGQCRLARGARSRSEKVRRTGQSGGLNRCIPRLVILERPYRRHRQCRRGHERPRVRTDPLATQACLPTSAIKARPTGTRGYKNLKSI